MLVFGGKPEANFSKADVSTLVSNPNFLKFRSPFEKIIRRPAACAIPSGSRSRFYARLDESTIIKLKDKRSKWRLYIRLFDSDKISHITFEQARCSCFVNNETVFSPPPENDEVEEKGDQELFYPYGLNPATFKQHKSLDLTQYAATLSLKKSKDKMGLLNVEVRSKSAWTGIAVIEVIFLRTSDDLFKRFLGYYYRNFSLIRKCQVCQREEQLRRCSRCKSVWYCSAEHQTRAWSEHQFHCEEFVSPPELKTVEEVCKSDEPSTKNKTNLRNFLVTTICPITKNQIETPVRGEYCNHLQCVDLKGYLAIQEELTNFACPICTKPMRIENINLDIFMQEILRDVGDEVDVVRVFSDGKYERVIDEEAPLNPIKLSPKKPATMAARLLASLPMGPSNADTPSPEVPTKIPSLGEETTSQRWKTIVFVRHGNSTWNQAMKFSQPLKAVGAMSRGLNEYMKLKFAKDGYDHQTSIIVDAPLSKKGITEAVDLARFLQLNKERQSQKRMVLMTRHNELTKSFKEALYELEAEIEKPTDDRKTIAESDGVAKAVQLLQKGLLEFAKDASVFSSQLAMNAIQSKDLTTSYNDFPVDIPEILEMMYTPTDNSVMVASNLRRAISTAVIAFWKRFTSRGSQEKLYILSCMQEFGPAADTQTELKENETPQASQHEIKCGLLDSERLNEFYGRRLDGTYNYGNKTNNSRDDPAPCRAFCDWCFSQSKEVIIATGHSMWFRIFCRYLNPGDPTCTAAKHKLKNCGVVGFRIAQITDGSGKISYRIAPRSITIVYGGFES